MSEKTKRFAVTVTFTEPMLGTAPADPELYSKYIATKKAKADAKIAKNAAAVAEVTAPIIVEELPLLPEATDENKGITVFRRDGKNLILMDFMVRGALKEAAEAVSGTWGVKSKIDKWLFCEERRIPILRDGKPITEPDDVFERPLRAQTMMGPRVALASSEIINAPASISFTLRLLPLGQVEKKGAMNLEVIQSWLEYWSLVGFGQWRSGSFGRGIATITEL